MFYDAPASAPYNELESNSKSISRLNAEMRASLRDSASFSCGVAMKCVLLLDYDAARLLGFRAALSLGYYVG